MEDSADISEHLRARVEARIDELGYTAGEFVDATTLSAPALANLRKGHRRKYSRRLQREVTRVLRWTPDSIERLLRDEEPIVQTTAVSAVTTVTEIPRPPDLAVVLQRIDELWDWLRVDREEWMKAVRGGVRDALAAGVGETAEEVLGLVEEVVADATPASIQRPSVAKRGAGHKGTRTRPAGRSAASKSTGPRPQRRQTP